MRPLVVLVEFLVKPSFTAQFRDLVAVNAKASLERKVGCKRSMCSSIQRSPRRFVLLYEIYEDQLEQRSIQPPCLLKCHGDEQR
jgi:quinol monooxygenase YgiN